MLKSMPSSNKNKKRVGYVALGIALILTAAAFGATKIKKELKKIDDDLSSW